MICRSCQDTFKPKDGNQKYCSRECCIKFYRRKWDKENKEYNIQRVKEWKQKNQEKHRIQTKRYRLKRVEKK